MRVILGCVAANGFQQPLKSSSEAERRADVYAIYSLMMTSPKTSHGVDDNKVYLIATLSMRLNRPDFYTMRAPMLNFQQTLKLRPDFKS